jgi:hypothetical protein
MGIIGDASNFLGSLSKDGLYYGKKDRAFINHYYLIRLNDANLNL